MKESEDEETSKNDKAKSMQITLSTQSSESHKEDKGKSQSSTDETSLNITDNNQEKKLKTESYNDNTNQDIDDKTTTSSSIKELMEDLSADLRRKLLFDDGLVNSLIKIKELLSQMKEQRTDKMCQDSSLCTKLLTLATRNDKLKISSMRTSELSNSFNEEQLKELTENIQREQALEIPQDLESSCILGLIGNNSTAMEKNHDTQDRLLLTHFPCDDEDTIPKSIVKEDENFIQNMESSPKLELASSCTHEQSHSKITSIICKTEEVGQTDIMHSDSILSNVIKDSNPKDIPNKDEQLSQGLANILQNANSLMLKIKDSSNKERLHEKMKIPHETTSISPSISIEKDSKQNNIPKESMDDE